MKDIFYVKKVNAIYHTFRLVCNTCTCIVQPAFDMLGLFDRLLYESTDYSDIYTHQKKFCTS